MTENNLDNRHRKSDAGSAIIVGSMKIRSLHNRNDDEDWVHCQACDEGLAIPSLQSRRWLRHRHASDEENCRDWDEGRGIVELATMIVTTGVTEGKPSLDV